MMQNINLKEHKEIIVIVAAVAIAIFFSRKILDENKIKISKLERTAKEFIESVDTAEQIKALSKRIDKYKDISWQSKESVEIMGRINKIASKYGITIHTFDPAGLNNKGNYFIFTMNLNISSDYTDLVRFLSALEELKELTKIKKVDISPQGEHSEENVSTRAYLILETYILKG